MYLKGTTRPALAAYRKRNLHSLTVFHDAAHRPFTYLYRISAFRRCHSRGPLSQCLLTKCKLSRHRLPHRLPASTCDSATLVRVDEFVPFFASGGVAPFCPPSLLCLRTVTFAARRDDEGPLITLPCSSIDANPSSSSSSSGERAPDSSRLEALDTPSLYGLRLLSRRASLTSCNSPTSGFRLPPINVSGGGDVLAAVDGEEATGDDEDCFRDFWAKQIHSVGGKRDVNGPPSREGCFAEGLNKKLRHY